MFLEAVRLRICLYSGNTLCTTLVLQYMYVVCSCVGMLKIQTSNFTEEIFRFCFPFSQDVQPQWLNAAAASSLT